MTEPIAEFKGEYAFLSNFYPAAVVVDARKMPFGAPYDVEARHNFIAQIARGDKVFFWFPSVEHAFQAQKTLDIARWVDDFQFGTPGQAKRKGRKLLIREDWEHVKLKIMRQCIQSKFRHSELRARLLMTHPRPLIEGNNWGDKVWGAVVESRNGPIIEWFGENWLGKLLVEERTRILYNETAFPRTDDLLE